MGKKKITVTEDLHPQILTDLFHIEDLEKGFNQIGRFQDMKSLQWETQISRLRRDVRVIRKEIDQIKIALKNTKKEFISIVNELKLTGQQEDYQKIKNMIDDWKPEVLITRREFLSLLNQAP